ncbi:MAG: HAD family hydrolase [Desulfuromonas sp.]|nr:MAG: HAD family hydrolase [Desulfuromonas sp.]
MQSSPGLYIALLSIHGLIRGHDLELGRDADTGGQTLYVLELAQALAKRPEVARVELITQLVRDENVSPDYAKETAPLNDKLKILRIGTGQDEYLPKEQLWDQLDFFADNLASHFRDTGRLPDVIHSHYADAGQVGSHLASLLGVPLIHTGHSLGRVKRRRLLASGLTADEIETRFNMSRRIEAEELTLATAERVITSTHQEIEEQYDLYDHYQPEQMRVVPPGTNLTQFHPPTGGELQEPFFQELTRHLKEPGKPLVLALSRPDKRKNISALVEAYGLSEELQEKANLAIIAGNRDDIDDLDDGAQEVFHDLLVTIDRYDLYGRVSLPKHHRRDQVPLIYRIAAASGGVFVNPALTEPFGLTLIEAAASGLPIVATEDGGPNDIIGNCQNGFLIDPLEPETITAALLKLLDDHELWRECARRGQEGVEQHYSWDAHAERYLKIVRPIADRSELLQRGPISRRSSLYRDRAIVSDLDLNLLGDSNSLGDLRETLYRQRKKVSFMLATGRRLDSALKLMKKHRVPEPTVLITSSGTEIYYAPKLIADAAWAKHIDYQWAPKKIRKILTDFPGLKLQPKKEQSRFKLSYFIDPEVADIEEIKRLLHQEEQAAFVQLAFGQYLDILPLRASKGMALRYVVDRMGIPLERVFVAGGSGADEDMMRGNTLAAVVANRHHEELSQLDDIDRIYFSQQPHAAGILEALDHYDFFPRLPYSDTRRKTMKNKLLLCTDMDRTIMPNGHQPEHPEARRFFREFCSQPQVSLAYVTGRHLKLVEEAIAEYDLPVPDYVISDVGTKIYRHSKDGWDEISLWQQQIAAGWQGKNHQELLDALSPCKELRIQEESKQNDFKLSYYLSLNVPPQLILDWIEQQLAQLGVECELVWSIDDIEQVGLLDILPRDANKREAIVFLQNQLGLAHEQVLFAGDSGNDLPVLTSPLRSILVANADEALKKQVRELAVSYGCAKSLYIARDNTPPLGGNYAAGVLQGIAHFHPEYELPGE